jgi:hypothetical protein
MVFLYMAVLTKRMAKRPKFFFIKKILREKETSKLFRKLRKQLHVFDSRSLVLPAKERINSAEGEYRLDAGLRSNEFFSISILNDL